MKKYESTTNTSSYITHKWLRSREKSVMLYYKGFRFNTEKKHMYLFIVNNKCKYIYIYIKILPEHLCIYTTKSANEYT